MGIWMIDFFSREFILVLAPLSLIAIGLVVETKYTGRVTLFANAMALVSFFATLSSVPTWAIWYTNIMTILGFIGFVSYAVKQPLFEMYYHIGKIGSSIIAGLVILTFALL